MTNEFEKKTMDIKFTLYNLMKAFDKENEKINADLISETISLIEDYQEMVGDYEYQINELREDIENILDAHEEPCEPLTEYEVFGG